VRFESDDHFIVAGNPDDSGSVRYNGISVAAGLLFKVDREINLYANAGRGFETPTLAELSYRPGGATGLNFALEASRSEQLEVGVKANLHAGQRVRLALFDVVTHDEIVVNRSANITF
jgi:iron complex outermembrane receptor protein